MSDAREMIAQAVGRVLADAEARDGAALSDGWNAQTWKQLSEQGVPLALVAESHGGIGLAWDDVLPVLTALGAHGVGLPVAETMLAQRLLTGCGLELAADSASFGVSERARIVEGRFTGIVLGVPWGTQVGRIVTTVPDQRSVVALDPSTARASKLNVNLAGESRVGFLFENVACAHAEYDPRELPEAADLHPYGALLRVGQIAGALDAALARTAGYVRERVQFGKPIGQFQAVQQQVATLAGESAAVGAAARAAYRAASRVNAGLADALFEIAAAKLRANNAVQIGATIAHQMHGAIGFTHEYALRRVSHRLWSWRSEFGNDAYWSGRLGAFIAARGPQGFWADLTARGDVCGRSPATSPSLE